MASTESIVTRGRSVKRIRRRINQHIGDSDVLSTTSTDSIPRSHSPNPRVPSVFLACVSALSSEGVMEYPGLRCDVKSMPYTNSKLGLSGCYTGKMDVVSKLPDGKGTLYCRDGRIFDGEWRLGGMLPMEPIKPRCSFNSESSDTCNSSSCSSLSANVTRHRSTIDAKDVQKFRVPKNLYIITRNPSNIPQSKS